MVIKLSVGFHAYTSGRYIIRFEVDRGDSSGYITFAEGITDECGRNTDQTTSIENIVINEINSSNDRKVRIRVMLVADTNYNSTSTATVIKVKPILIPSTFKIVSILSDSITYNLALDDSMTITEGSSKAIINQQSYDIDQLDRGFNKTVSYPSGASTWSEATEAKLEVEIKTTQTISSYIYISAKTIESASFYRYGSVSTMAYRPNAIGINCEELTNLEDNAIEIHAMGDHKNIALYGIIIDCGTW